METYVLISAENKHGEFKTVLVRKDELEDSSIEDFFLVDSRNFENHGEVEISGEATNMMDAWYTSG